MRAHKDIFAGVIRKFVPRCGTPGRLVLEALRDLCEPLRGENARDEVEVDGLIGTASTRAAVRDPIRPLDQKQARLACIDLFREFEAARLGALIVGRRRHRTRFRFSSRSPDEGATALWEALIEPDHMLGRAVSDPDEKPTSTGQERPRKDDIVSRLKSHSEDFRRLGVSMPEGKDAIMAVVRQDAGDAQLTFTDAMSKTSTRYRAALFGSIARDDARPDSDVDLLAAFDSGVTSEAFFDTKFFLEDLLGRRVDLVTEAALRDRVRSAIEPELIRVA